MSYQLTVLVDETNEDDLERIVNAIELMRGVVLVTTSRLNEGEVVLARLRAANEIREKLVKLLREL